MKKIFSFIITLTLIVLLSSCGKTCYVTFQSNGELYDFIEVQSGKKVTKPTDPTKAYHNFIGWYNEEELFDFDKKIKENITLNAKFEAIQYTYTFIDADGTIIKQETADMYSTIEAPKNPKKPGYKFTGWDKEFIYLTEDITIQATYEELVLEGSVVSILGDSISTFYDSQSSINSIYSGKNEFYYPLYSTTVKSAEQTWWYKTIEGTNTILGTNESLSGSDMVNSGSKNIRLNNLGLNNDPDIVIIFLGTNDNVNGHTIEKFKSAYESAIKYIQNKYPGVIIFCCTLGYSAYTGYFYTEARRQAINKVIYELVENYELGLIDLAVTQNAKNYTQYLGDSLHPNDKGMEAYSATAINAINEYFGKN